MTIIDQLARDEGKRSSVYQDSEGLWTVGIGICVDSRRNDGLTDDEMFYLCRLRVGKLTTELNLALPWTKTIDEVRLGVLQNMAYEMGVHGLLNFKKALAAMAVGNWEVAATNLLNSPWAEKQSPARANRLAVQLRSGLWT